MTERFENQFEDDMGLVRPDVSFSDDDRDFSLRPKFLKEFLGQTKVKNNLHVFIEAAKSRQEPMDHLFLIGPPGLGKTARPRGKARARGHHRVHREHRRLYALYAKGH